MRAGHVAQDVEPVAARHVDVEDQQVVTGATQRFHGLLAGIGFIHLADLRVVQQELPQSSPHDGVVVDNQDVRHTVNLQRAVVL